MADPVLAEMVRATGVTESRHYAAVKPAIKAYGANGEVSTVGLFYSRTEVEKIVAMLRDVPERSGSRYEIVEAMGHLLAEKGAQRAQTALKE
jgi:hypothetical protein